MSGCSSKAVGLSGGSGGVGRSVYGSVVTDGTAATPIALVRITIRLLTPTESADHPSMRHSRFLSLTRARGMALVMVLVVVAFAAVMSWFMLGSSALQVQVTGNLRRSSEAECLAESGLNLATYYLQNPDKAPAGSLNAQWFWPGASGISLGSIAGDATVPVAGTVDVTVTSPQNNMFDIVAVGRAGPNPASRMAHTSKCRVTVQDSRFFLKAAILAGGDVHVKDGVAIIGDIQSNRKVTLDAGAIVNGVVTAMMINGAGGTANSTVIQPPDQPFFVPDATTVTDYRTYVYKGVTYTAGVLPNPKGTDLTNITLNPSPDNPAGIWWTDKTFTMGSNVTINGTLLVLGGDLTVMGTNNFINAQPGFPALWADQHIKMDDKGRQLTVNGLVWVGDGFRKGVKGSQVTINGGLIIANKINLDADTNKHYGGITITYDASKVYVPDFVKSSTPAVRSVKIVTWTP